MQHDFFLQKNNLPRLDLFTGLNCILYLRSGKRNNYFNYASTQTALAHPQSGAPVLRFTFIYCRASLARRLHRFLCPAQLQLLHRTRRTVTAQPSRHFHDDDGRRREAIERFRILCSLGPRPIDPPATIC